MLELFRSPRRAIMWFVEASLLSLLVISVAGSTIGWAHALGYEHFLRALGISVVAQASIYYHGLYGPQPIRIRTLAFGFFRALGVAGAVLWILFHFVPRAAYGQGVIIAALGGAAVILPAWRAAWQRLAASDSFCRPTLILGGGALAEACAGLADDGRALGLRLAGVLTGDDEAPPEGRKRLGRYGDLRRVVAEEKVGLIVVAPRDRRGALPMEDLLDLKFRGVEIEDGFDFYERAAGRIFVRELRPSHVVLARGFHARRGTLACKRALDVALAGAMLVLSLPILVLAAIAVKLDSAGPVLYSQIRAGAFGKPFLMFKLRSMRTDAEAGGAVWAVKDDPRVTRVGAVIRRTRIDELPQLWNVLAGEMSLVGPRPERPVFVEQIEREIPFFRQRLAVKPGVTGHAQVRYPYGASIEDAIHKLEYDLFYIKRLSIWFDISILIDTVKVVLLRIGSR